MKKRKSPPPYPPHICTRLKRLRQDHGLSQQEVASYLGIRQQSYSAYESGLSFIQVDQLVQLARLYNVSVDFITGASNLHAPFPRQ